MRFNKKTDYAIILVDALKLTHFSGQFLGIAEIAKKHRLPKIFLEKLAMTLREHGIVESKKGKAGGYRLKKNPAALTLLDVIRIFEETKIMKPMRKPAPDKNCPVAKFAPAEKRWAEIDQKIKDIFKQTTFA